MTAAPHPSSIEWKRVIATAVLGGVTFERVYRQPSKKYAFPQTLWYSQIPDGPVYKAKSKYEAALLAISWLGAEKFLPDAASPQTARSGPERT